MKGVVLYNPTDTPVNTSAGQVDGFGWRYFEDREQADRQIENGHLLVSPVPEVGTPVNERAFPEFQKYWDAQKAFEEENKKVRDTVSDTPTTASTRKTKGSAKTNESEA